MSRGHIELVHAPEIAEEDFAAAGWPVQPRIKVLSADPLTGALTGLVRLPAGYRRPGGHLLAESELIMLDGSLRIGETIRDFGYYEYAPSGTTHEPWSTETGATMLFFARDRTPEFVPRPGPAETSGRIEIDSEALPWTQSPIPGPSEGLLHKTLRMVEATGEMTVLVTNVRHYDYPMLEFHDCVEEIYLIEGDIWLGNSGLMREGSYFWRPPFITHGPFYSETGALMLVWVPSSLVNHVPESASSTPEENIAAFVAAGGERVVRDAVAS
jgi:hypothetical protein